MKKTNLTKCFNLLKISSIVLISAFILVKSNSKLLGSVSVGQEIKIIGNLSDNISDFSDANQDKNDYFTGLYKQYIEGDISRKLSGKISFKYAGLFGVSRSTEIIVNGVYIVNNLIDIDEACIKLKKPYNLPLYLTFGRQLIEVGNGYILSTREDKGLDGFSIDLQVPYFNSFIKSYYLKKSESGDFRPNSGNEIVNGDYNLSGVYAGASYKWLNLTGYLLNELDNFTYISSKSSLLKASKNFYGAILETNRNNLKAYLEYSLARGKNTFGEYNGYAYFIKLDAKAKLKTIESRAKLFYSVATGDKENQFNDSEQVYANKAFPAPNYRRFNIPEYTEIGEIFNLQYPGFSNKVLTGIGFEVYPVNYVNFLFNYFIYDTYLLQEDDKVWGKEWDFCVNFEYSKNLNIRLFYGFLKPGYIPSNDIPNLPNSGIPQNQGRDAVLYKAELLFKF